MDWHRALSHDQCGAPRRAVAGVLVRFPELNVRTYVRLGDRPGIYFFRLDAGRAAAVQAARTLLNLPYHLARMR
jgi:uncharacterized protein YqjF (DUF2071 family)